MDRYAKMLGAAQGGLTSAAMVTAMAAAALQFVPEPSRAAIPWWGYIVIFVLAAVVCVVFPALSTYLAPANKPADLPQTIDVPVNVPVRLEQAGEAVTASVPAKSLGA